MNILIVEDNALMRAMICETISACADVIAECTDGDDALAAYQASLPDWVLMDIQMPRVDGLTATRQIKTAYPTANICVVTAHGDAHTRRAAESAGATAFVLKENLAELCRLFASRKHGTLKEETL